MLCLLYPFCRNVFLVAQSETPFLFCHSVQYNVFVLCDLPLLLWIWLFFSSYLCVYLSLSLVVTRVLVSQNTSPHLAPGLRSNYFGISFHCPEFAICCQHYWTDPIFWSLAVFCIFTGSTSNLNSVYQIANVAYFWYTYIHAHVCVFICIHTYTNVHIYVHIYMHMHIIYIHTYIHICLYMYICVFICVCTYRYTHRHIHTYM